MTRINVIPVEELSDQWLIAEYHELPRVIKQKIDTSDAPERYRLGKGHVKWAKKHSTYVIHRYWCICAEMERRGFKVNFPYYDLLKLWDGQGETYVPDAADLRLNIYRLVKKYKLKPDFYKWTNRSKPNWLIEGLSGNS